MADFPVDDILLLDNTPQHYWGPFHSLDGIIFHSTEGGGWSRDAAVGTRNYQMGAPGSYNWIIYDKDSPGAKGGALLTIPYMESCGGVNPGTEFWHPERYPELKQNLDKPCPVAGCPGGYRNPTMHNAQIAFSGRRIAIDRGRMPENMVETAIALRHFLEAKAGKRLFVSGHFMWQTNRSDPGKVLETIRASLPDTSTDEDPAVIAELEAAIERKNRRIDALEDRRDGLLAQLAALADVEAMAAQVEALAGQNAELKKKAQRLRSRVATIKAKAAAFADDVADD